MSVAPLIRVGALLFQPDPPLLVRADGTPEPGLDPAELRVVAVLASHANQPVSKEVLYGALNGSGREFVNLTEDQHTTLRKSIQAIREAIGQPGRNSCLQTIQSVGYMLALTSQVDTSGTRQRRFTFEQIAEFERPRPHGHILKGGAVYVSTRHPVVEVDPSHSLTAQVVRNITGPDKISYSFFLGVDPAKWAALISGLLLADAADLPPLDVRLEAFRRRLRVHILNTLWPHDLLLHNATNREQCSCFMGIGPEGIPYEEICRGSKAREIAEFLESLCLNADDGLLLADTYTFAKASHPDSLRSFVLRTSRVLPDDYENLVIELCLGSAAANVLKAF